MPDQTTRRPPAFDDNGSRRHDGPSGRPNADAVPEDHGLHPEAERMRRIGYDIAGDWLDHLLHQRDDLRAAIADILATDDRGQGLPYAEAMERAARLVKDGGVP